MHIWKSFSETLEIDDPDMILAIEKVQRALDAAAPKPGRLRVWIALGVTATIAAGAIFWLPGALMRQTLAVVPNAKRVEIGAIILAHVQTKTGAVCRDTTAQAAAGTLATRVFGAGTPLNIVVVPKLDQGALAMPGGLIILDAGLLQAADDPVAVAGFVLASHVALGNHDSLEPVLRQAGLATTFGLLTTGDIPRDVLQRHTEAVLDQPAPQADPADLRRAFAAANLPQRPYQVLADARSGTMPDLGRDPLDGQPSPPVMTDSAWISLQNICNR